MNVVVLVLGTGQCGSSAVAGALRELGVWMGDEFVDVRPYPTWEDAEMARVVERIIEGDVAVNVNPFVELVEERREREVWGFKYPRLVWVIWWLLPLLDNVRLVVAERGRDETLASFRRVYRCDGERAGAWFDYVKRDVEEVVRKWEGPVLRVRYEDLVDDPGREVERLAEFTVGEVGPARIEAAVASIRRRE